MTARGKTKKTAKKAEAKPAPIIAYKGFDAGLKCRDFQYEIGKTYKHEGEIVCCPDADDIERGAGGFHACLSPFDVWNYYPPTSRFAEVVLSGENKEHGGDSKIAAAEITIKAELTLPEFIKRGVDFILARAKDTAEETGNQSAATNTGNRSAASVEGKNSIAIASGIEGRAKAAAGSAIVLCEYDNNFKLIVVHSAIAGKDGIKPDTWYTAKGGKLVEVEE